jgi:hypothetical protein
MLREHITHSIRVAGGEGWSGGNIISRVDRRQGPEVAKNSINAGFCARVAMAIVD